MGLGINVGKFAWSLSRLGDFETCPLKYKYKSIDRVHTPPNKYAERGIRIHELGEKYLKGKLRSVPKEYAKFKLQMQMLKKESAISEGQLAFDRKWNQTGWFDDNCWFRIKIDARYFEDDETITIIDFKTGRVKDYAIQQDVSGFVGLLTAPNAERAKVKFWFLDHGTELPTRGGVYLRKKTLPGSLKMFESRAARMEKEKKFNPTPGAHCSYCDFSKRKGGPCKY